MPPDARPPPPLRRRRRPAGRGAPGSSAVSGPSHGAPAYGLVGATGAIASAVSVRDVLESLMAMIEASLECQPMFESQFRTTSEALPSVRVSCMFRVDG